MLTTHLNWQEIGVVATGGTVLQVVADHQGDPWLASPAGLFHHDGERWSSVQRGLPFWRVNTVLAAGRNLWVSGQPNGIMRSTNGGRSWQRCWLDQTDAAVISMSASPDFGKDRIVLAGTDGDGILRSTDGGRHWELCNFGLREFVVLDVLSAPAVGRYEHAFALTENGVYLSPNAGRAWRRVEDDQANHEPSALAISPDFVTNQTVYLGNQSGELMISKDAGRHWRVAAEGLESIEAVAFTAQGSLLMGTSMGVVRLGSGELESLADGALTPIAMPSPVLTLATMADRCYAGLADGLYTSEDDGRSWLPDESLAARRFVWFESLSPVHWLAAGPEEGIWMSRDGASNWQMKWQQLPVLAVAASTQQLYLSVPEGVARSVDAGATWEFAFQPAEPAMALAVVGESIWAAAPSGLMWCGNQDSWQQVSSPVKGGQLLSLLAREDSIIAALWSAENGTIELWRRSNDAGEWTRWFAQPGTAAMPQIVFRRARGWEAVVALGADLYVGEKGEWQRQQISERGAAITALAASQGRLWAALTDRIYASADGESWEEAGTVIPGSAVVKLQVASTAKSKDDLVAATAEGRILATV